VNRFRHAVVSRLLRCALAALCKIDSREFTEAISRHKPMIVAFNHVNFLEVPILAAHGYPAKVSGLVKAETWKNPFFAFLFNSFGAVPLNRGGAFSQSFKQARAAIAEGFFICVAPEGTRNRDGVLGRGKPGIIQLAIEADAPILPVAHCGGEKIWQNLRRFKRTEMRFRVGPPFKIKCAAMPGKSEREEILAEVMGQMARLLPEELRGEHAARAEAPCAWLEFI